MNPITGVTDITRLSGHGMYVFFERETFDIAYCEHLKESPECKKDPNGCMCDVGGRVLVGDWRRTWVWRIDNKEVRPHTEGSRRHKVWEPSQKGTWGFSAIYNRDTNTIQVTWSKWTKPDARMCSPCYPGQANIDTENGNVTCFTLPPNLLRTKEEEE